MKRFTIFVCCLLAALPCAAQEENEAPAVEFKFGGTIETVQGLNWKKGLHYSASRNIAQIKGEVFAGSSYAFISAQAEYNHRNLQRTGFRLNEAYYRYSSEIWDLTVGRQIIAWGQADGFALTDVISAKDNSEFVSFSQAYSRLASDALRIRFFHDIFTFEAIAIPFFTPNKIPRFSFEDRAYNDLFAIELPDSFSMNETAIPINYTKHKANKPKMFADTEAAAKFSFFLPAMDFSFSAFYGWDKTPEFIKRGRWEGSLADPLQHFHPETNKFMPKDGKARPYIELTPNYYRIGMAGFDAAIPAGPVLVRLEAAWVGGRKFNLKTEKQFDRLYFSKDAMIILFDRSRPAAKNQLLMLAGIDWTYGSWFLSGQYFEDLVPDHKGELKRPMHEGFVSLNFSKTFLRETLKLSASGVIDINYGSTFSTCSLDYALTDNLHLAVGGDFYNAGHKGNGKFAEMEKISSMWFSGKFSW